MAKESALKLLQVDLGQLNPPADVRDYMVAAIDHAISELHAAQVPVDIDNPEDIMLIVRYAAWWYKARDKAEARPWQLQREINNRKVNRATGEGGCCR